MTLLIASMFGGSLELGAWEFGALKFACLGAEMAQNVMSRAIGAVVAQQLYTLWVGGSNPSSPTILLGKLI